jgi:predicted nucleotide-binding protein
MANGRSADRRAPQDYATPSLRWSRSEAAKRLAAQIEQGNHLKNRVISSKPALAEAQTERTKWNSYNHELLLRMFTNTAIADEYSRVGPMVIVTGLTLSEEVAEFVDDLADRIARLESIAERLELIPAPDDVAVTTTTKDDATQSTKVFIVHGHDVAAKESVARFLSNLRLTPVILHEQPNEGKTIIEKFERHAADVAFAVILLTADDIGGPHAAPDHQQPRARQNVIFELGYFVGKLSRAKVAALHTEVELPTDILGVVYIPIDAAGAWRFSLAKELRQAGLPVDLNDV